MSRKPASGEWDRINLRIRKNLKAAIEGKFGTSTIPQKTFSDFLSSIAEAHLLQHGVHVDGNSAPKGAAGVKAKPARKGKLLAFSLSDLPKAKPAKPAKVNPYSEVKATPIRDSSRRDIRNAKPAKPAPKAKAKGKPSKLPKRGQSFAHLRKRK